MTNKYVYTILPIIVIVAISFIVALGLFKLLESTASVGEGWYNLGGGIAGFAIVFWMLRSWHDELEKRHLNSTNIATSIASLYASNIVSETNDSDDVKAALGTSYSEAVGDIEYLFREQDKGWLKMLLKELQYETHQKIRKRYRHLKDWEIEESIADTIIEKPSQRY